MKAHAVVPADAGAERLVGWVLCHDVRGPAGQVVARKGERLGPDEAAVLESLGRIEVHALELEPGDLHEDPAGERLACAAMGVGVLLRDAAAGQWALVARHRGLLRVDVGALRIVNGLEGLAVYTLFDGQVVDDGEVVARAKVTPLAVPESLVLEAERVSLSAGGLVRVSPFRPTAVAALGPAHLAAGTRHRFEAVLREKLAWFGAPLVSLGFAPPEPSSLAQALRAGLDAGAGVLVAAGANGLDPLDPLLLTIERLGGRFVRRGVPAHPGSLLWLASLGAVPVLGLPSCGMFSQATLFDLVLARLLAGDTVGAGELADYGHGGLLGREMAFRFPPYRAGQDRGALPA